MSAFGKAVAAARKIKEGKEMYASKAAMKKHEKAESPRNEKSEEGSMKRGASRGFGLARGSNKAKVR